MSDKVKILILGYRAQSGKDTFYSFIKESHEYVRAAFADKLKKVVQELYQFSDEQMYGNLKDVEDLRYPNLIDKTTKPRITWAEYVNDYTFSHDSPDYEDIAYPEIPDPDFKKFLTSRRVLQVFGQQQRQINPNIWADYVFNVTIPNLIKLGHNKIVITDFRFPNESEVANNWALNNKAELIYIRIDRPNIPKDLKDISENALNSFNKWNYTIINDSSLIEYQKKCIELVDSL